MHNNSINFSCFRLVLWWWLYIVTCSWGFYAHAHWTNKIIQNFLCKASINTTYFFGSFVEVISGFKQTTETSKQTKKENKITQNRNNKQECLKQWIILLTWHLQRLYSWFLLSQNRVKTSNNMKLVHFFYHSAPLFLSLVQATFFSFSSFISDETWCILSIMSLYSPHFSSAFQSSMVNVFMCSYLASIFAWNDEGFSQERCSLSQNPPLFLPNQLL